MYITFSYISNDMFLHMTCFPCTSIEVSPVLLWTIEFQDNSRLIGLDSYSRQVFIYLDPILIYISLWIDCLFEIRKIAVCFLRLSLPGDYRVTDEALLAETT